MIYLDHNATNQLLLGPLFKLAHQPSHLIVSAIEHPCVLEPARVLETLGWACHPRGRRP